jgi:hypothetical protein
VNAVERELDQIEHDVSPYVQRLLTKLRPFIYAFVPAFVVAIWTARNHLTLAIILAIALSVAVKVIDMQDPGTPLSVIAGALARARYRSHEPLNVTKTPPARPPASGT